MAKVSNDNELINPEENVKSVFDSTRGLISETGDYAKKNKLSPCMSFSIYCVLIYFIFIFLILIYPLKFSHKVIGVIVLTCVILVIIYMTFKMHKYEICIEYRYKKEQKYKSIKKKNKDI